MKTIGNEYDEPMKVDKEQPKRKRRPEKAVKVKRGVYNVTESQYYIEGVYTPRYGNHPHSTSPVM